MRIDNNNYNYIAKLYKSAQPNQAGAESAAARPAANKPESDSVHLSEQAVKINELIKATQQMPEVREAEIARLKAEIANNTYKVSAGQLAEKMLSKEND